MTWQAQAHDMPGWWPELARISGVDDHQELAWKVWASFKLPQQISEWHGMENYHQALPAPLCICQKDFLLQPDPNFACQDIRESQLEKMVGYAHPSSFGWKKLIHLLRANPPFGGSILELRKSMECYISFPQQSHLWWCGPPRGIPGHPVRGNHS